MSIPHRIDGLDAVTDGSGNTYLAGRISPDASDSAAGPIDLDPARTYPDNRDILATEVGRSLSYVAKYVPDGSLDWVQPILGAGTSGYTFPAISLATAPTTGGVYFTGRFFTTLEIGTTTITTAIPANNPDRFAGKLNSDGSLSWVKALGTPSYPTESGIVADEGRGRVFVVGTDFLTNPGRESGVVIGINIGNPANVQVAWVDRILTTNTTGYGQARINNAVVDSQGNVIAAGSFSGTADFDPGPGTLKLQSSSGSKGLGSFLWKLNGNGGLVSVQRFEPANNSGYTIQRVAIDASDNVYAAGSFAGTVDFQVGKAKLSLTSSGGSSDAFLAKFSPAGNVLYATRYGGASTDERATRIALDATGVYIAGYVGAGPGVSTGTFVAKYDRITSVLQWQFLLAGTSWPTSIAVRPNTSNGSVWLLGGYWSLDTNGDNVPDLTAAATQGDQFWLVLAQS